MAHRRSGTERDGTRETGDPVPHGLEVFRLGEDNSEVAIFSVPLIRPTVPASVSRAEGEIALLLDRGMSRTEIARARGRSLATINNQIRALYGKLRVGSRGRMTFALRSDAE